MNRGGNEDSLRFHLLLCGFVVTSCVYLFFLGPWGHDAWFHLQRLVDIDQQLADGRFRAHFAENAAQGKGLPVWVFYSQWAYWPAIFLMSVGVGPLLSLKLTLCVFFAACCVGSYRLLRLQADRESAAFGTLLFMTSNYVVGEVFQRAAYAEFLSVALLPGLLLAMHRIVSGEGARWAIGLVVLASLMILFHPLSFMNAGPALAAYALYLGVRWRIPLRSFLPLVPLFALALGLTAFFWLPAVLETRYVLGAEGVPTPLRDTFLSIGRYFNFSSITNLGVVLTLLVPAVFVCMVAGVRSRQAGGIRRSWPLVGGIIFYGLLTLRVSEPLYEHVPLLASTLWVWRVLFPLTLLAVILVTANLGALPRALTGGKVLTTLASLAVAQAVALVLWNSASELRLRPLEMAEIEDNLTPEFMRMDGFGIGEYLPDPDVIPDPPRECETIRSIEPEGWYETDFLISPGARADCIHVPYLWNVRYEARIDGEDVPIYADDAGELVIFSDEQTGQFTLHYGRRAYVILADAISGASVLATILLVLWLSVVSRERARASGPA